MADYIEQIRKDLEDIELTDQDMLKDKHRFTHLKAKESRKSETKQFGIEYRNMHNGIHNLIVTDTEEKANEILNILNAVDSGASYIILEDISKLATDVFEINYRDVDNDGMYNDIYVINYADAKPDIYESRKSEAYTNLGEVEVEYNYTESGTVWLDIRHGNEKKYQIYGTIEGVFFDFEADDFAEAKRIIKERLEENEIHPFDFDFTLFKSTESSVSAADTVTKATFEPKVKDTLKKLQSILDQFKSGNLEFENAYRSVVAICNNLHREFPGKFPSNELNERGGDEPQSLYEYLGEEFAAGNTDSLDSLVDEAADAKLFDQICDWVEDNVAFNLPLEDTVKALAKYSKDLDLNKVRQYITDNEGTDGKLYTNAILVGLGKEPILGDESNLKHIKQIRKDLEALK